MCSEGMIKIPLNYFCPETELGRGKIKCEVKGKYIQFPLNLEICKQNHNGEI